MILFTAWLESAFTAITGGFAALFTGRVIASISAVALYSSLTAGLAIGVSTGIATALEAAPSGIVTGASWIIPARFPQLIALWLAAQSAALVYRYTLKVASYNPFRGAGG